MKDKLQKIQLELKAPKSQFNAFGKYKYRNAEDILESVKPLLQKYKCTLKLSDELVQVGERYYVKATAEISDIETKGNEIVTAYAREEENIKGMHHSQITGSSSSYARKYALNGLFLIDDTKDSDYINNGSSEPEKTPFKSWAEKKTIQDENIEELVFDCNTQKELIDLWHLLTKEQQNKTNKDLMKVRKQQLLDEGVNA